MNNSIQFIPALVLVLGLAGCATRPPTQTVANGWGPSWSPDNRKIVYAVADGYRMELLDLDRKNCTLLTMRGKDPVWSPDGRHIAFVKEPSYNQYTAEEVWIIEPNGDNPKRVAAGGFPRWSGDGKTLYVHSRQRNQILACSLDKLDAEPAVFLKNTRSWYPAVSPDGRYVAWGTGGKLEVIECTTGEKVLTWDAQGTRGLLPSWSPDGKCITFGGFDDSKLGLWCVDFKTTNAVQLAKGPFTLPMWSKDGRHLAFDCRSGTTRQVWTVNRAWINACLKGKVSPLSVPPLK